jgi:hypothetical protein
VSLEDEIKREFLQATIRNAKELETHVNGDELEVTSEDVDRLLMRRLGALEGAVLMLAREIDGPPP